MSEKIIFTLKQSK